MSKKVSYREYVKLVQEHKGIKYREAQKLIKEGDLWDKIQERCEKFKKNNPESKMTMLDCIKHDVMGTKKYEFMQEKTWKLNKQRSKYIDRINLFRNANSDLAKKNEGSVYDKLDDLTYQLHLDSHARAEWYDNGKKNLKDLKEEYKKLLDGTSNALDKEKIKQYGIIDTHTIMKGREREKKKKEKMKNIKKVKKEKIKPKEKKIKIKNKKPKKGDEEKSEFEKGMDKIFVKGGIGDINDKKINSKVINSMLNTLKKSKDDKEEMIKLQQEINMLREHAIGGLNKQQTRILRTLGDMTKNAISSAQKGKNLKKENVEETIRGGKLISYFGKRWKEVRDSDDMKEVKDLQQEYLRFLNSKERVIQSGLTSQALESISSRIEQLEKILKEREVKTEKKNIKIKIKKIKIKIKKPKPKEKKIKIKIKKIKKKKEIVEEDDRGYFEPLSGFRLKMIDNTIKKLTVFEDDMWGNELEFMDQLDHTGNKKERERFMNSIENNKNKVKIKLEEVMKRHVNDLEYIGMYKIVDVLIELVERIREKFKIG